VYHDICSQAGFVGSERQDIDQGDLQAWDKEGPVRAFILGIMAIIDGKENTDR
jgi:hypothetical protein